MTQETQAQQAARPAGGGADAGRPAIFIAEDLRVSGISPGDLLASLRAHVLPGALLRSTGTGWALDARLGPGGTPVWRSELPAICPMDYLDAPVDEQAAMCLRMGDALALGLGLGRGHVLPVFENPLRRAMDAQILAGPDDGAPEDLARRWLDPRFPGVPVGAVLGLRHEGGGSWSGYRPILRGARAVLSVRGEGMRRRLTREVSSAGLGGFSLVLIRPLAAPEAIAMDLPEELGGVELDRVLSVLEATVARQGVMVHLEGGARAAGVSTLRMEPEAPFWRLALPRLPATVTDGPGGSAAMLSAVIASVEGQGGAVVRAPGPLTLGTGSETALRNVLALSVRHPVLTRMWHPQPVGPWSAAARLDEAAGDVPATARRALESASELVALEPLTRATEIVLAPGELRMSCGAAAVEAHRLLAAAAATGTDMPWPAWPLRVLSLPSILSADLDLMLSELERHGFPLDPAPLQARLARTCPLLVDMRLGGVRLCIRRALCDRRLPGPWEAVQLEIALEGAGEAHALGLRRTSGVVERVPLARFGAGLLGSLVLPLGPSLSGPCAGMFPVSALEFSLHVAGQPQAGLRVTGAEDWQSAEATLTEPLGPVLRDVAVSLARIGLPFGA
ncbi:hypothetical protein FDP22_09120 [Paroceanicella profunda]|uniref:Uncharacterized protein n=1 Tax=Paroceanicella profunda TaxID=2579971 RepID=A0A5B8FH24_9RHOB|nr:hypothetical protein [Paroceanicella profunda]QDL91921.1 hypothetical protein FDP22_09120 [Paroceanicella profunda]